MTWKIGKSLLSQLRDVNDQLKDTEEDRESIQERYMNAKRELENKNENAEKDIQIKFLTSCLNELNNLEINVTTKMEAHTKRYRQTEVSLSHRHLQAQQMVLE